ncbi:MAG TPA: helix-turn-helix transcriptional regulator [Thermomonas sp.]|uniref:helix-turn-helix domain-containing protein n=1 Tax=Thermomonas sp. TaxID=1971895 RepID=UPI002BC33A1F|nr:helix-turn-helix transcriptional regulator [Thermomonas sp.]HOV96733.1 helix-turn-helix transcriptional regulator [Thermomonas sp.]
MNKLAHRIRKARLTKGLSQLALAEQLGVTRGAVANWESSAGTHPATDRLLRIAEITDVSVEWLASGRRTISSASAAPPPPSADAVSGNPQELQLLRLFRTLPLRYHAQVITLLEAMLLTLQ